MEINHFAYFISFGFLLISIIVYAAYQFESNEKNKLPDYENDEDIFSPDISVVIAAKNESENLDCLFNHLEKLDYDIKHFEVIIVNDDSSDSTENIAKNRISGKTNFHLFNSTGKLLPGKKGALAIGIQKAKFDFIAITDADCKPEKQWLKSIAAKLDAGYDFVFGVAPVESGTKLIEKISAFESMRNFYLNIAAAGLNMPFSAAARSFALRKKSFEKIGGYSNTIETLSGDDDLLLCEAVKNKMQIGTFMQKDSLVFSAPPDSLKNYLKQKKRHLQTSFHYLPKQKLFLGMWFTTNIIAFLSVFAALISPIAAIPFCVKMVFDVFISMKHQKELGHTFRFYQLVYLQFFYELFVVVNFFNSLSGKTEWK